MNEEFTPKDRKKIFDKMFKEKIMPFFKTFGFERHTKTSKRLFKDLGNGLSVFFFFEFKNFGGGFYDIEITYFDDEIGDVYDDEYLVIAQIKKPSIKAYNSQELVVSTELWLQDIQTKVMPFIEKHKNHSAILNSDKFYYSKSREIQAKELLRKKSTS